MDGLNLSARGWQFAKTFTTEGTRAHERLLEGDGLLRESVSLVVRGFFTL